MGEACDEIEDTAARTVRVAQSPRLGWSEGEVKGRLTLSGRPEKGIARSERAIAFEGHGALDQPRAVVSQMCTEASRRVRSKERTNLCDDSQRIDDSPAARYVKKVI